jgi:UDP-glucose 6-dehydrogenase
LVEKTAAYDAAKPQRNLIGIPVYTPEYTEKAESILRILPEAPYNKIMSSGDAEMVKYAGNCFLFTKVIFMNLLYDIAEKSGCNFEDIREAFIHDLRIGESHTQPVHTSGHITGSDQNPTQQRGAGGHCLIKDFEAFRTLYAHTTHDIYGDAVLKAMAEMNVNLLLSSNKDKDLLEGVYGTPPTVHEVK